MYKLSESSKLRNNFTLPTPKCSKEYLKKAKKSHLSIVKRYQNG